MIGRWKQIKIIENVGQTIENLDESQTSQAQGLMKKGWTILECGYIVQSWEDGSSFGYAWYMMGKGRYE